MTVSLNSDEPRLRAEDHRAWNAWMKVVWLHGRTLAFRRAVDSAQRVASLALESAERPSLGLSGGKDSTCMAHLVGALAGRRLTVYSEKDDLDYPGEEEYVLRYGEAWGLQLEILRPPVSPTAWIEARAARMSGGEDVHGRSAGLSKACFYGVVEAAEAKHDVSFLGLRAEESAGRRAHRARRGLLYEVKSRPGLRRCMPIGDWKGIDVYAYAEAHGIELLHVYRCIGFLEEHRRNPALIRKSWWLPGKQARHGQAAWLRRYYPSLFEKFRRWFPDALSYA